MHGILLPWSSGALEDLLFAPLRAQGLGMATLIRVSAGLRDKVFAAATTIKLEAAGASSPAALRLLVRHLSHSNSATPSPPSTCPRLLCTKQAWMLCWTASHSSLVTRLCGCCCCISPACASMHPTHRNAHSGVRAEGAALQGGTTLESTHPWWHLCRVCKRGVTVDGERCQ